MIYFRVRMRLMCVTRVLVWLMEMMMMMMLLFRLCCRGLFSLERYCQC